MITIVGIAVSVFCAIPVIYFLHAKLTRKGFAIDLSFENLSIVPIESSNTRLNGRLAICMYHTSIVNKNTFSTTIKKVELFAGFNKKFASSDLYNLRTGKLSNGDNAIVMNNGQTDLVLMKWVNLGAVVSKSDTLLPGGILRGSAVFVMEMDVDNPKGITALRFVVHDYLGNKSTKTISIGKEVFKGLDKNFRIVDREFVQTSDTSFQWKQE